MTFPSGRPITVAGVAVGIAGVLVKLDCVTDVVVKGNTTVLERVTVFVYLENNELSLLLDVDGVRET